MTENKPELIPDLALDEYRPAGSTAWSLWQRFNRKVNWDLSEHERRVWLNPTDDAAILIDSQIDSCHCEKDAKMLLDGTKPGVEILTEFSQFDISLHERGDSGERVLSWSNHGLNFTRWIYATDQYLHSTLVVSRTPAASNSRITEHVAGLRANIRNLATPGRKRCIHVLWRFLYNCLFWSILVVVPAFVIAALVAGLLSAVSDVNISVALLYFPVAIGGLFAFSVWIGARNRAYLKKTWSLLFHQGDYDGTIRRALGSIGAALPSMDVTTRSQP